MIYINTDESIVKVVGDKDECLADIYNLFIGLIRCGISPYEIVKEVSDAARKVGWEGDQNED